MVSEKAFKHSFIVFGETVWDVFPDEKRLGGAPLNFAYYFLKAGGEPFIISAVGKDELGEQALKKISGLGLDISGITENGLPTGTVDIRMEGGRHRFRIIRGTAWEALVNNIDDKKIARASGLYVGTLARISKQNEALSNTLLDCFKGRVIFLDVNLRSTLFSRHDIGYLLQRVTHVKMNEKEARLLQKMGYLKATTFEGMARELIGLHSIEACCITLGRRGAVGAHRASGVVKVKGIPAKSGGDSVGAGDGFAAFWIHSLLSGCSMQVTMDKSNTIGCSIASSKGAILDPAYFSGQQRPVKSE